MNETTKADLYRHCGLTGIKGFLKGWCVPGFRYIYLYRKSEQYKKNPVLKIYFRFIKRRYKIKYGFEISSGAQIGGGFCLSCHSGHVIIGPIKIGKNCNINHSVTIGRAYKDGKIGRPTIDDYVWIGTGSVLVGNINIGKNVLIAPNSFVNFDVPDNSLVIGNPAKIIKKDNPTKYYINDILYE
jgi:serine O-acetyltransferase